MGQGPGACGGLPHLPEPQCPRVKYSSSLGSPSVQLGPAWLEGPRKDHCAACTRVHTCAMRVHTHVSWDTRAEQRSGREEHMSKTWAPGCARPGGSDGD